MPEYTDAHARSGIDAALPAIETWANQYADYEISVEIPEYNAICPKTELPDFGHLTIRYVPDRLCLELKSLKLYIVAYRNVGIFYENAVNRILDDCVAACRPKRMTITGTFSSRGGISSTIEASYPRSASADSRSAFADARSASADTPPPAAAAAPRNSS